MTDVLDWVGYVVARPESCPQAGGGWWPMSGNKVRILGRGM
jgi:hypothetical protein